MKSALEILRRNTSEMAIQREQVKVAFYNVIEKMAEKFIGTSVCCVLSNVSDEIRSIMENIGDKP